jgi:rhamnulokinase
MPQVRSLAWPWHTKCSLTDELRANHARPAFPTLVRVVVTVGGGCQNALLCQWTADASGRTVVACPVEATALGNVLVQAIALGLIGNFADAREVARRSIEVLNYKSREKRHWDEHWERFAALN